MGGWGGLNVYAYDCGEDCLRLAIRCGPLWSRWVEKGVQGDCAHDMYILLIVEYYFLGCPIFVIYGHNG